MSVMQFVQKLSPGGLEILSVSLASQLSPKDVVVSLEGEKNMLISKWKQLTLGNYAIEALQKKAGIDFSIYKKLFELLNNAMPKAVLTHHIGPLLYAGIMARLCGINNRIHIEHDAWHLKERKRLWVARLALFLARPKLVAVSNLVALELAGYGFKNITVIQNGIDIVKFSPQDKKQARKALNLPEDTKIFGSAGRLETVKGHDLLLEAFAKIFTHAHLVIAGDGSQKKHLKELALSLGINKRVHFLGHIETNAEFYSALDCFIMPSRSEGLPLALLEAQACNIPAICFDVGGIREGLDPKSGHLVAAQDTHALALAIAKPLEKSEPRQFITENFDLQQTIARYRAIIGD